MSTLKAGDRVRALATLGLVAEDGTQTRFAGKVEAGAEGTVLPASPGDSDGWHSVRFDGREGLFAPVTPDHVELVVR